MVTSPPAASVGHLHLGVGKSSTQTPDPSDTTSGNRNPGPSGPGGFNWNPWRKRCIGAQCPALYWCAVPGVVEEAAGIRDEFATGKAINLDDVRSEWGLPDSWPTNPPSTIA